MTDSRLGIQFLERELLQSLLDVLVEEGYTVVGPTIDQEAIVYREIHSVDELPRGWTDEQEPGKYRLRRRDDEACFGFAVGPQSWKRFLFPPLSTLAVSTREGDGWIMKPGEQSAPRYAFLGMRACELAAIEIQDRVFTGGQYVDPVYASRRENAVLIAVNCTQAASTCFCDSMKAGPRCKTGFDLALTEIATGFTVETGSELGESLLARIPVRTAAPDDLESAERERQRAVDQMTRRMDTVDLRNRLLSNLEHPRWSEVAQRCLSCTNCTMVCPTCFCSSVNEVSDLPMQNVERQRHWDSCFNPDFSSMHGGIVRDDIRSRYRQWLTHKLASWHDQFGTSGCVGCGRCITWCPVGIDITEEVRALTSTT
ncbi:MAG: 4Fe-4S dicluster domain-containing protein [Planctomycetaceae bacterium]